MLRSLESKNKREAYVVFEEQGRISTWIGSNLSKRRLGRIHSRFPASLNLEFEGQLIHLDGGRQGLCSFGICVAEARMGEILAACRVGNLAVIADETLRIYGSGGVIFLDLQEFDRVDLSVTGILAGRSEQLMAEWLKSLLEAEKNSLILGLERTPDFVRCVEILEKREMNAVNTCGCDHNFTENGQGNQDENRAEFVSAVSYLYGRGQGLTPSGDDILVGYWSILQVFSGTQSLTARRAADRSMQLEAALKQQPSETTDISKAYLSAIGAGYANEIFFCAVRELKSAQPDAVRHYLSQLKSLGHTSGCDTVYGMYLGMKYILRVFMQQGEML